MCASGRTGTANLCQADIAADSIGKTRYHGEAVSIGTRAGRSFCGARPTNPDPSTGANPNAGADTGANPNAGAYPNAYARADPNGDANPNPYAGADPDPEPDPVSIFISIGAYRARSRSGRYARGGGA